MSILIQYPNQRLSQSGIGNPVFDTDIVNINENLLESLTDVYGLDNNSFAIISGFAFNAGYFTPGIVFMKGKFYKTTTNTTWDKYLQGVETDVYPAVHSDASSYPTYRIYTAIQSNTQWNGMPALSPSTIDSYRLNLKYLRTIAETAATTTNSGRVELATSTETQATTSIDATRAVTPSGLASRTATETRTGIVALATVGEVATGTDTTKAVTAAGVKPLIDGLQGNIDDEALTRLSQINGSWNTYSLGSLSPYIDFNPESLPLVVINKIGSVVYYNLKLNFNLLTGWGSSNGMILSTPVISSYYNDILNFPSETVGYCSINDSLVKSPITVIPAFSTSENKLYFSLTKFDNSYFAEGQSYIIRCCGFYPATPLS
jgi:hypothetical protein